ncbi:hypothetical protein G9C98_001984 [Cotesia typhae]|uniref:Uncharacterized protein n=1 Tax=Cotesia typhae TaxID=2053667 RepID=A0A8J5V105_9HYME|nr:hypothetical protein G9C98_001984 [Cotesia typhae]
MQRLPELLVPAKSVDIATYHSTFYSPPPTEASRSGYDSSSGDESENDYQIASYSNSHSVNPTSSSTASTTTSTNNAQGKHINKGRWTKEEDALLKQLVSNSEKLGKGIRWDDIASHFKERSDVQCQQRWAKVVNPELVKGPWTKELPCPALPYLEALSSRIERIFCEILTYTDTKAGYWYGILSAPEDEKVVELVERYGPKKWTLIARHLKGRIGKQCRERWHNHLNPGIKKTAWTDAEDKIIVEAHRREPRVMHDESSCPDNLFKDENSRTATITSQSLDMSSLDWSSGWGQTHHHSQVQQQSHQPTLYHQNVISIEDSSLLRLEARMKREPSPFSKYFNLDMGTEASGSGTSDIRLVPMPDFEDEDDRKTSPPPILRRRRQPQYSTVRIETINDSGNQSVDYLLNQQSSSQVNTAPSTPIKQLPFSPSQFLNSLASPETSWPRASTPKGSPGTLTTPQPSGLRRNQEDGNTPRTPTPFKDALAEIERRSGATTQLPATPSRLDALTEIIRQETDRESLASSSMLQDSGYGTGRRRGKENSAPGGKRARKALCQAWAKDSFLAAGPSPLKVEHQSQSQIQSQPALSWFYSRTNRL